jgi:hypothetical protein
MGACFSASLPRPTVPRDFNRGGSISAGVAEGHWLFFFSSATINPMTISEIVSKIWFFHQGKSINHRTIRKYLNENKIRVNEEIVLRIFDVYNRRLIDEHMKKGEEECAVEFDSYTIARKELDDCIAAISKNLSTSDIVNLKQKINNLYEAAIVWSHK